MVICSELYQDARSAKYKKQYTLSKVVSKFLRLPYHLSDVRSKGCASRVDRYSSVVIVKLDALPVSPKGGIAHGYF